MPKTEHITLSSFQGPLYSLKSENRLTAKPKIHILANKRDLWEKSPEKARKSFEAHLEAIVNQWRQSNLAQDVSLQNHSNEVPDDIVTFIQTLTSAPIAS